MKTVNTYYIRDEAMVMYDTVRDNEQVAVVTEETGDILVTTSIRQLIKDNERRLGTGFCINKKLIKDTIGGTHLKLFWIREKMWVPFTTAKTADYMMVCLDHYIGSEEVSEKETIIILGDNVTVAVGMSKASVITKLSRASFIRDMIIKRRSLQYKEPKNKRHILKEAGNVFYTLKKK